MLDRSIPLLSRRTALHNLAGIDQRSCDIYLSWAKAAINDTGLTAVHFPFFRLVDVGSTSSAGARGGTRIYCCQKLLSIG